MKNNPFLGSLRAVAIAIGKREGVNIIFEGSGAKTDGRNIYLPATLPADNTEMEVMLRGFLDHEVGHIKHTDFGLSALVPPLVHTITNVLEDIRIEQLMGREYPGCAVNLRELVHYMRDTGVIGFNKEADPIMATLMAISFGARVRHLRNDLSQEAFRYRKLVEKYLGSKAMSIIDMVIQKSGSLTSTAEARELAQKVFNLLQQAAQEPPPPQPEPEQSDESQEDQEDSDEQEEGEGNGASSGESDGENEDNGDSTSDSGSSQDPKDEDDASGAGDSDGEGKSEGESLSDGSDGSTGSDSNMQTGSGAGSEQGDDVDRQAGDQQPGPSAKQRQNLERLLDASEPELEEAGQDLDVAAQAAAEISKDATDAAKDGTAPLPDSSGNTGEVRETQSAGSGNGQYILANVQKTAGLRGKLAGLFQSTKLKRDTPQLTGHKLDRRVVHRIAAMTPDTRLFQRRNEKVADNTAIEIIVDKSGSMRQRIETATAAAFSVAKAVESMPGVKCAVAGFPATTSGVVVLKGFSEKPDPARFAIGVSGGTPLDVALRWAGQKLWPRQENRKIVLVLTDGEPDDTYKAKEMVDLLIKNDIECYGIGIGAETSSSIRRLFGEHAKVLHSIEDLAGAMFDTMTAAMTKRR